jgi:dUTPase
MDSIFLLFVIILKLYNQSNQYVLNVCSHNNDFLNHYYSHYKNKYLGDSCVDLLIPTNYTLLPQTYTTVDYQTSFVMTKNEALRSYSYYIYARSSMSKYPLIYVNGVNIIDAGYRGNLSTLIFNPNSDPISLTQGNRIAQICAPDLSEIKVINNCQVPSYGDRGHRAFGSSGK